MAEGLQELSAVRSAAAAEADDRLGVFISYSRRDSLDFAGQLATSLDMLGFRPIIDREGISGGEAWRARLGQMILEADTVVFVLSPESAESPICAWEVEEAARLSKRILPVIAMPLASKRPPERLASLNYIHFIAEPSVPGSGFGHGLAKLNVALKTDLVWLRQHREVLMQAETWSVKHRDPDRLLAGNALSEIERWAASRPATAPDLTTLQREYLAASRAAQDKEAAEREAIVAERERLAAEAQVQAARARAEAERAEQAQRQAAEHARRGEEAARREAQQARRATRVTIAGLAVAIVLAAVAGWLGWDARQKSIALTASNAQLTEQKGEVERQRGVAQRSADAARAHLQRAAQTSSLYRADQSKSALQDGDPVTAAIVAMSGVPDAGSEDEFERTRPFYPEAFHALHDAWLALSERDVLTGHSGGVVGLVAAPDGSFMVSISDDTTARIWSSAGKLVRVLSGHRGPLTGVAVSPDGSRIALGSKDQSATVWTKDGDFESRLIGHAAPITDIAFSPDGQTVLTASRDRTAKLWALDGKERATLAGHGSIVNSAVFLADGSRVLTASRDGSAAVWRLDGTRLVSLLGHTADVVRAVATADGALIATASQDRTARVWTADGRQTGVLAHDAALIDLAVSPDGKRLLTGSESGITRWRIPDLKKETASTAEAGVTSVAFSRSGEIITFKNGSTRVGTSVLMGHGGAVYAAALLADGAVVATASADGTLRLWDLGGPTSKTLLGRQNRGKASADEEPSEDDEEPLAVYSHDGSALLVRSPDARVGIFGRGGDDGKQLPVPATRTDMVTALAVSADGSRSLTQHRDGHIRVWDRAGREIARLAAPTATTSPPSKPDEDAEQPAALAALSADGAHVARLMAGVVEVWAVGGAGAVAFSVDDAIGSIETVAFSTNGAGVLIVADKGIEHRALDGVLKTRHVFRQAAARTIISPDRRRALRTYSTSEEQPALSEVIDIDSGRQLSAIDKDVRGAVFSNDGNMALLEIRSPTERGTSLRGSTVSQAALWKDGDSVLRVLDGRIDQVIGFYPDGRSVLVGESQGTVMRLTLDGQAIMTLSHGQGRYVVSPDGLHLVHLRTGGVDLWPAYQEPQALVDEVRKALPRCLDAGKAEDLYLTARTPDWCKSKYPFRHRDDGGLVSTATVPPPPPGIARDFAYYPPGDIQRADLSSGRMGDRKVYFPEIAFPLRLEPDQHAFLNSQIWGYGGGGWGGQGAAGGSECDPRNYDSMKLRDVYCEVRGFSMPYCPAGTGSQGQSIRPPTCKDNAWDVVAVVDGVITLVTSNTTVQLKGADGTEYRYLHMHPGSITVARGERVRQGQVIGRVSKYMMAERLTTLQLNFSASGNVSRDGKAVRTFLPVYSSLIAAYRELKGLDRGIDKDGSLIVDPDYEIGAGKIPRPPD